MDHSKMDHSKMDHAAMGHTAAAAPETSGLVHVPPVDAPAGAKVLSYTDLKRLDRSYALNPPDRTIDIRLTGNMEKFIWSFDDRKFSESEPLQFHYGERLTLVLINDSMMLHPIHLHGMWSEVYSADGRFQMRKNTVTVQPGQRLTYRITADAPGRWAYHCPMLYHMEAGMFREVVVGPATGS